MPSFSTIFSAVAVSAMVVSAAPVVKKDSNGLQPAGWATGYLEEYSVYHTRYLSLDCQDQHNTTFFDSCCHPLLSTEDLSSRPSQCTPSASASSSAAEVVSTATALGNGTKYNEYNVYCDEATSVAVAVSSAAEAAAATATESVSVVTLTAANSTATVAVINQDLVIAAATTTSSSEYAAPTTSSSEYVAPSTSTSEYVAPTTTSTTEAPAATTSAAASSGGSGTTYSGGYATYFYQNGVAGECGTVHSDSDYVIAIDTNGWWSDYQSNSNSPYCGKSIVITNTNNGKSVTAVVTDACPSCVSNNSLDLSVGAFNAIASESDGMVPITWQWA